MKTTMITRTALAMVVLGLNGSAWAFSGSGSGTAGDPYIITNVNQLQEMQNDLDACYALGNDIDASDTVNWNGGEGFLQVGPDTGDPNDSFTGKFDGRGHVITGLYINRPSTGSVGLFGFIYHAQITNVGLINADVTALGGAGTLVGSSEASTISNSWASGTVTGTDSVQSPIGGLIGWIGGVGGFVSQCHSSVDVFAISSGSPANRTGGLTGLNSRGSIIEDCYATGNVSGKNKIGGLVGDNVFYSEYGGYIARCYSTGQVTGNGGGLIGYNYNGGITYDSYWDTQTSGRTTSYGGTPKPTSEMKKKATFVGWDFVNTWDIQENVTYPFLRGTGVGTGPIAHWKFDEGTGSVAYDSAGNNDGTIYGAAWAKGVIDGALDFDGVDDYVDCGSSLESVTSSSTKTIMGWAKSETISYSTSGRIITMYKEDGTSGFSILASGNPAVWGGLYRKTGDTSDYLYSDIAVVSGQWTHITLVQEDSRVELYINGVLADSAFDAVIPNIISPPNASVGAFVYSGGLKHPFEGMLDEVRIYDRALSAGEIEELYNSVPVPPVGQTYHVDGVTGDNTNDGLTRETAFKTIQRGINVAEDFDTVLVWPDVYNEEIAFWGDAITVKSAADAAIVETDYGYAFSFFSAEGSDTLLSNFVIRNSQYGIYLINGSSPTLRNLTIVNNDFGISAFNGADPDINSCIFWNNYYGDLFRDPVPLEAKYSWLQDEVNEPIAHWKFDEGSGTIAYDSAGTNNGTLCGSPNWVSGISGKALDFDGVGERDYVLIAGQTGLLGGSQFDDITVEAWFKTSTINDTGPYAAIVADETTDGEFAIAVNEFGNAYGVIYMEGSTGAQLLYGPNATDGEWHNLCLRKDSSEVALFVDVTKCDTVESTGPLKVNQQTHVTLGCKYTTYLSVQFIGIIDEVRIYDRALSDMEIEAMYKAGLAGISYAGPGFVDAAGGDYHLLSERGRYWPAHDVWVLDDVTSSCIDGGDPAVDPSNERMPNGGRINMGAYGGTAYASMNEWPLKHDSNFDGVVDMRDLAELALEWLETIPVIPEPNVPDVTPPEPVPAIITIWAVSSSSIMMTATEAFDESGVQYYFEATTPGGHDSGWQDEPNYIDVSLLPDTTYCYRVKARDKSANHNETIWSPQVCAVTFVLPDTLAPLPDPMQWDPVLDANGYDGRPLEVYFPLLDQYGAYMRAIDADDQAPAGVAPAEVEYYFQCQDNSAFDSGWRTVAAYPNEDERRAYTVPISQYSGHAYRFRVKARDVSDNLNETDWSDWYPAVWRDPP